MKKLFLPVLVLVISTAVFSCSKDDKKDANNNSSALKSEMSYSVSEQADSLYNILWDIQLGDEGVASLTEAVGELNSVMGTNIEVYPFDEYFMNNPVSLSNYLAEGIINQTDYNLLTNFENNLNVYSYSVSVDLLIEDINGLTLTNSEYERYELMVNSLIIAEDFHQLGGWSGGPESFKKSVMGPSISAGCAVALASNAVATVSLAGCAVPGPWCGLAIVGKGLSMAGVALGCP